MNASRAKDLDCDRAGAGSGGALTGREIRNPKSEIRRKSEARTSNFQADPAATETPAEKWPVKNGPADFLPPIFLPASGAPSAATLRQDSTGQWESRNPKLEIRRKSETRNSKFPAGPARGETPAEKWQVKNGPTDSLPPIFLPASGTQSAATLRQGLVGQCEIRNPKSESRRKSEIRNPKSGWALDAANDHRRPFVFPTDEKSQRMGSDCRSIRWHFSSVGGQEASPSGQSTATQLSSLPPTRSPLAGARTSAIELRASDFGFRISDFLRLSSFEFRISPAAPFFPPCTPAGSLLEAVTEAAKRAPPGDAVWLSPACSSFDRFRNAQQRGAPFCTAVKSIGGGAPGGDPKIRGENAGRTDTGDAHEEFATGFCEGKPRSKNKLNQHLTRQPTPTAPNEK